MLKNLSNELTKQATSEQRERLSPRFLFIGLIFTLCLTVSQTSYGSSHSAGENTDFYHASANTLSKNFKQPPEQVSPWVYWYWLGDNITKKGIENDLAAMQRAGIGTALIGIIEGGKKKSSITTLSNEWWDHVRFAIKKAADYNIDIGLFNSPGWSQSGGPWVPLEKSMRYLSSQEFQFSGPQKINLKLKDPDTFFQDVRILAFKTPSYEKDILNTKNSKVVVSSPTTQEALGEKNTEHLFDENLNTVFEYPKSVIKHKYKDKGRQKSSQGEIQFDFITKNAFEARTLEIYPHQHYATRATFLAKKDDGSFKVVKRFDVQRPRNAATGPDLDAPIVINFPAIKSTNYRLILRSFKMTLPKNSTPDGFGLKEIVISKGYKIERYVEKKLAKVFPSPTPKFDSYLWPQSTQPDNEGMVIGLDDVLDITDQIKDGVLTWKIPDGDWTIARYFMKATGATNGPSSKAARGPEIDKLSKPLAKFHFDAYIGKLLNTLPPEERTALKYTVVDSYEKGAQNWTDGFAEKFEQQFGYDPIPYLPVYSGRVVNSIDQSERFLWDARRMIADRVAYEYTAGLRERSHENGLKLWLENYGHWGFPGEFLQYGGQADILSGEFWTTDSKGAVELKAASSAAHIYGHKTVMAESFTSRSTFTTHPWELKKRGDWSFIQGVNHTLLHVYIHQAYDDELPGVNAWFGSEFNRHNTWFDLMGGWINYIKRANYMLQQGNYAADLMYFIGEDAPKMTGELNPTVPEGFSYDFINGEVIVERLTYSDGLFRLPGGTTFKLLVLPNLDNMRVSVLSKLQKLVAQGGAIYGPKPTRSPSLENYPLADQQVVKIANSLWQNIGDDKVTRAQYGKGHVFYQSANKGNLAQVMNELNTAPDVLNLPENILWTHRASNTHDIYFLANQSNAPVSVTPSFRIDGLKSPPQRWDPVTGDTNTVGQYELSSIKKQRRTAIPTVLKPYESTFFVFKKIVQQPATNALFKKPTTVQSLTHNGIEKWLPSTIDSLENLNVLLPNNGVYEIALSDGKTKKIQVTDLPDDKYLDEPWHLTFEKNRDVPVSLSIDHLKSLAEFEPTALKHYSGKVMYRTKFNLSEEILNSQKIITLDLGDVGVVAQVTLNGKKLGQLWSRPLTVDITNYAKPGNNHLEVLVATTWRNRMVADAIYPKKFPDTKEPKQFSTSFTSNIQLNIDSDLEPSGLIGPVKISFSKLQSLR